MITVQSMYSYGALILFYMAIAVTGFSAFKQVSQDRSKPIPKKMIQILWTVPVSLWAVYGLARLSMCW